LHRRAEEEHGNVERLLREARECYKVGICGYGVVFLDIVGGLIDDMICLHWDEEFIDLFGKVLCTNIQQLGLALLPAVDGARQLKQNGREPSVSFTIGIHQTCKPLLNSFHLMPHTPSACPQEPIKIDEVTSWL